MAAQVILGVETEEPNKYDFEFIAKFIPLCQIFFSDSSSSTSSSSMSSSSSSSSSPSSPVSGYVQKMNAEKTLSFAHQCTSSRCTECAEARAAGFDGDKSQMIHHEPRLSPVFLSLPLVSTTHLIKKRETSLSSDSDTTPPTLTLKRIGSLNQWASEIVGP
jgi:hypothetical protein